MNSVDISMVKNQMHVSLRLLCCGRPKVPVLSIHLGTDARSKSQYLNSCSRLGV